MQNIIFDMDGTLINSGSLIANTINHVRNSIGLVSMDKDEILRFVNDPNINPAQYFYNTENFTDKQTVLFEEYYNEHFYIDLELYDGIENMLNILKDNYFLSIATNANDYIAKKMLSRLNIDNYFKVIVGANNVKKPKPHPDMVLKIIDDCKLNKNKTILIGDSPKDEMSAKSAGIESMLVHWGFTDYEDLKAISNIDELIKKIYLYNDI
jgi:phosphoglycolate phosphatase